MANHEPLCTGMKFCEGCKRDLPVLAFAAKKSSKDGLYHICRECKGKRNKIHYANTHTLAVNKFDKFEF